MTDTPGPLKKIETNLKTYYCPYCNKSLLKGNIKTINMVCHHCQRFIKADAEELSKRDPG